MEQVLSDRDSDRADLQLTEGGEQLSIATIEFLKKEYGTGGFFVDFSDGTEGYVWYAGKGISIDRHGISTEHDLVLSWSKVENRLRELIKDNRYLNPKEKGRYADL